MIGQLFFEHFENYLNRNNLDFLTLESEYYPVAMTSFLPDSIDEVQIRRHKQHTPVYVSCLVAEKMIFRINIHVTVNLAIT